MLNMFGRTKAPQKEGAVHRPENVGHFLAREGIFVACCDIYLVQQCSTAISGL